MLSPPSCERAFLGTVLHTPVRGQLEVLPEALIVVGGGAQHASTQVAALGD